MPKSKEEILKLIDENKVRYIRLWFTDILGQLKGMSITRGEIEHVLEDGQGTLWRCPISKLFASCPGR